MKFEVGQRVKVVKDAYYEVYVGALGTIIEYDENDVDYPFLVRFDRDVNGDGERWFSADELTHEKPVNVMTIEGDVSAMDEGGWSFVYVGETRLNDEFVKINGKRVKLTLEVID